MKKVYISPIMSCEETEVEVVLGVVSGQVNGQGAIGYGGVDTDGSKTPAAKEFEAEVTYGNLW